jgi:beta-lactamase class C
MVGVTQKGCHLDRCSELYRCALHTKAKKISAKTQLVLSGLEGQSIKLSDGTFVLNNKNEIGSDIVLTTEEINQAFYVIQDADVLYAPLTTLDNQVYSKLIKGDKVYATKKATTNWGTYYQVILKVARQDG